MAVSTDPISPAHEGFMSELSDRSRRGRRVRAASEADMPAVRDIYAHYVLHSLATFEETPPTLEEMLARRQASIELGLPYLVAEAEGRTLGFAYAAAYRARPAYRFTIEDSLYVADGLNGRGIGSALLGELIAACERGPWRQMLAVVGDSANAGSIALHRRFGFELVGTLRSVGFKLGRWVDTPILQRALRGQQAVGIRE
jgi:L-amino acid N-acyltransferase YncA